MSLPTGQFGCKNQKKLPRQIMILQQHGWILNKIHIYLQDQEGDSLILEDNEKHLSNSEGDTNQKVTGFDACLKFNSSEDMRVQRMFGLATMDKNVNILINVRIRLRH